MTRRIAILLTNDDDSAFAQAYPNDGEKFATRLRALRPDWVYDVVSAKDGVLPPCAPAYDGYLITGSPASVNADMPWVAQLLEFIRELDRFQLPTVGLCFGHQAIAKALGGTVGHNPDGWCLGVAGTDVAPFERWMQPAKPHLNLFAAHNEQVLTAPAQARVLSRSDFCPVGSFAVGQHFFTSQYHPEISRQFMGDLLDFLDGKLDAALISKARSQVNDALDDELLFAWIVQFLEMPRTEPVCAPHAAA